MNRFKLLRLSYKIKIKIKIQLIQPYFQSERYPEIQVSSLFFNMKTVVHTFTFCTGTD